MSISNRTELVEALLARDANRILGTSESRWIEFKAKPYDLTQEAQKLELAKDASGMLNGGGGEIVLGFATREQATSKRDTASAVHPISRGLVDVQAYQQVIRDNTYPPIREANVRFWPSKDDAEQGIFTISLEGDSDNFPVLVHSKRDARLLRGHLVGIYKRVDDDVDHYTAGEIHADIKLGRLISRRGLTLQSSPESKSSEMMDLAEARLEDDWRASESEGHRRYFLQAYPASSGVVDGLGLHSESDVREAFTDPPKVRDMGFGLGIRSEPEVLPNGGARVTQQTESRSLERSGLLTWTCSADRDFLAWAEERRKQRNSLHPLALAESTYCFFLLFLNHVLPAMRPSSGTWVVRGGMRDLHEVKPPSSLCAGELGAEPWFDRGMTCHPAPASGFDFEIKRSTRNPGEAAYGVLTEVYANFGLDAKAIPYCDGFRIEPSKFPRA